MINIVFTGIFMLEALLKILGQGPSQYFRDGWNRFDFIIALFSTVGVLISENSVIEIKSIFPLFRAFRVLRILRLLRRIGKSL